jgi:hypothetical protein
VDGVPVLLAKHPQQPGVRVPADLHEASNAKITGRVEACEYNCYATCALTLIEAVHRRA